MPRIHCSHCGRALRDRRCRLCERCSRERKRDRDRAARVSRRGQGVRFHNVVLESVHRRVVLGFRWCGVEPPGAAQQVADAQRALCGIGPLRRGASLGDWMAGVFNDANCGKVGKREE